MRKWTVGAAAAALCAGLVWAAPPKVSPGGPRAGGVDGPAVDAEPRPFLAGDAARGRDVFRFETFGNEGFRTDAVRVPQGMVAERVTPLKLLEAGLHVDGERVPADIRADFLAQWKTDLSAASAPLLHDPEVTGKLVAANAVVGLVGKDSDGDGVVDLKRGDKVGVSCALCHTVADGSAYHSTTSSWSSTRATAAPSAASRRRCSWTSRASRGSSTTRPCQASTPC